LKSAFGSGIEQKVKVVADLEAETLKIYEPDAEGGIIICTRKRV